MMPPPPGWVKLLTVGDTRLQRCGACGAECCRYQGRDFLPARGQTAVKCPNCASDEPMTDISGDVV